MSPERIHHLMRQYHAGTATPEEEAELMQLLAARGNDDSFKTPMDDVWKTTPTSLIFTEEQSREMLQRILPEQPITNTANRWWTWAAAAAILLILAGSGIWFLNQRTTQPIPPLAQNKPILPGGNNATLTLSNGQVITLEAAQNGTLSQQGGTTVTKLKSGQLAYNNTNNNGAPVMNTLATPRGGQYQLTLPDGTIVWLNAASSLTFPSAFNGKTREVQLKGEAFFEVATNARLPFHVKVEGEDVQVLGTSFNLNAYPEEKEMKTTLVQGAVKVKDIVLQPGQQARVDKNKGSIHIVKADLDATLAWKNGLFTFNDATIAEVMQQIARWYDVEIIYPHGIPQDLFRGEMYRKDNLDAVLKILAASGVNFTIQGKTITVTP